MPPSPFTPGGAPEPAKKGGNKRLAGIIGTVVVIAIAIGIRVVPGLIESSQWKEGACIDYYPTAIFELVDPKIVDCSSGDAQSKIVGILDGDREPEDCLQFNAEALVTNEERTKSYCLVEV